MKLLPLLFLCGCSWSSYIESRVPVKPQPQACEVRVCEVRGMDRVCGCVKRSEVFR